MSEEKEERIISANATAADLELTMRPQILDEFVGQEVVVAVIRNEDVGVVAQRVVEGRLSPRIHHAIFAVGTVEDIIDVMGGIGDVFKVAGTVKAELVSSFPAVAVVGHNSKLQVDRSKRWRQEARNGYVHRAVIAAATPTGCNNRQSVKNGQVSHRLQGVLVHDNEYPTAPG